MIPPSINKHRVPGLLPPSRGHLCIGVHTKCVGSRCCAREAVKGITMCSHRGHHAVHMPPEPRRPWPKAQRRTPVSWCRLVTESFPPSRSSMNAQATAVITLTHGVRKPMAARRALGKIVCVWQSSGPPGGAGGPEPPVP